MTLTRAPRGSLRLPDSPDLQRGAPVRLTIDGAAVVAYEGESVAAVMFAEGCAATRRTRRGASRGVYCGIGLCFECLVTIDGTPSARACMTRVAEGMVVCSQEAFGTITPPESLPGRSEDEGADASCT